MSGFLLVATTPQPVKAKSHKHKVRSATASTALPSTRALSSVRSIHTSTSDKSTRPKKVFDMSTLQYVNAETLMTPFEKRLLAYHKEVEAFRAHDDIDASNELLNKKTRPGSHAMVFTPENIELLRYCYYENFEPTYKQVTSILEKHTPSYTRVIEEHKQQGRKTANAKNSRKVNDRASVGLYAEPVLRSESCMAAVLRLPVFWNDVYHDIKYELSSTDYYDWLPAQLVAQKLVVEVAELALGKLHWLLSAVTAQELMKMNADEVHELGKHYYFYFGHNTVGDLERVQEDLVGNFATHMRLHTPVSHQDLLLLLTLLISCVCDNLRIQYYGRNHGDALVQLFGDVLSAVVDTLWTVSAKSRTRLPSTSSIDTRASSVFDLAPSILLAPSPEAEQEDKPKKKKGGFFRRFK